MSTRTVRSTPLDLRRLGALLYALALFIGACGDSSGTTTTASGDTSLPASTAPASSTAPLDAFDPEADPWPTDEWPVSTPEEQGMDSGRLADLVDAVVADGAIDSVMVVRNGYSVLDAVVHPFPEDTDHIIHSCTKSITATLIGIAIDRALLAGVDVPVVEILADAAPAVVDDRKAAMTVEDLLTMSSGLDCRDSYVYDYEGMIEMQTSGDWTAHVLALPMAAEPGTRFEYCNGASLLLSAILSEVTGKPASEFATEALFDPLGITDVTWPASPEGVTIGWGEMVLRPADMARFGYLYLRGGEWDGERLVSLDWVDTATATQIDAETLAEGYGYQWWVNDAGHAVAQGFGGQRIIVIPEYDLVVVYTAALAGEDMSAPDALTTDYVLPAVSAETAIPANPEAQARLAAAVAAARSGPEPTVPELPAMAAAVDGVRYEFRSLDAGRMAFALRFGDDAATLSSEDADGVTELEIGLAGRYLTDTVLPVAARGAWRDDTTFAIEYRVVGQVERGTIEFIFEDDLARVTSWEAVNGTTETITADRMP